MTDVMQWGMIFGIVVLAFCVMHVERRVSRVFKKMRQVNARLEAMEKAAGMEQTKTDIGIEAM